MASIRPRGKGYEARIIRKGQATQSKTFTTLKDAQIWARRIESAHDRGMALGEGKADKVLLSDLLTRYLAEVSPTHKGHANEALRLNAWLLHPLARRWAHEVKAADLAAWRDARRKEVAASTLRNELSLLSSTYETARLEWGYTMLTNPCKGIRRPKLPEGRSRRLSDDELCRIVAASNSAALKALIPLAVETSCRRGELMALTWRDVDLGNWVIRLRETKNGTSRTVAISPKAMAILKALPRGPGRVFDQTPHSLTVAWTRACKRARVSYEGECKVMGLEPDPDFLTEAHLHDVRHEAASRMFEEGWSIPEVSNQTGHKDWRMLKRYTHVNPQTLVTKLAARRTQP